MVWWWAACGGETPVVEVEVAPPRSRPELVSLAGRWLEVRPAADGTWAVCAPIRGIEIRDAGAPGWELVLATGDEIEVWQVESTEPGTEGVRFGLNGRDPVQLRWTERDRRATFAELSADAQFAAPGSAQGWPSISCR